ncbi:tyrosine-protein phosphatase, partial [bacterium]|nr:tyrosine-protein phosphatase [bacterium]
MLSVSGKNLIRNLQELRDLRIPNLRVLRNFSLSGPTLEQRSVQDLNMLKKMGINGIIDFREDAPVSYRSLCRQNGFDYFRFPLDNVENPNDSQYYESIGDCAKKATESFIEYLKRFLKLMKEGHVYAGCQYGIDRTNKGLSINYFFGKGQFPP